MFQLLNSYSLMMVLLIVTLVSCSESDSELSQIDERELEYTAEVQFLDNRESVSDLLNVAVADNESSRSAGLMSINSMPQDAGMLFIFEDEQPRSFWMSNTPLALDIIFINEAMEVVRIHRNAQPFSEEQILSGAPAKYVVEVNAGYTLSHDITEGMQMAFDLDP